MAKIRLQIGKHQILMKNIEYVVIDGVTFSKNEYKRKSDRSGIILQKFYSFIKRNKASITQISYKNLSADEHLYIMFLKEGKLHSENGHAIQLNVLDKSSYLYSVKYMGDYYLDGKKMNYLEWKKMVRKIKLEKLNN